MKKVKLFVFLLGLFAFVGLTKQTYAQDTANVTITYKLDGNVLNEHTTTPAATSIGDVLTVPAKIIEGEFLFWTLNGAVRRDLGELPTLRAISTMDLVAHYASANKKSVVYLDSNLQLLDVEYLETETPTPPSQPNKPLSISEGWALITNYNNEVTPALPEGNLVYYVAKYSLDTTSSPEVTLTLGENITPPQTTNFNEVVIVEALETVGGKAFSHYVDENNQILSKQRVYSFTLLSNMTISAVYETPELESVVNVRGPLELRSTHNTYVGQFELLENQTLIEYGFMFKQNGVDKKVPSNTLNTDVNEFMISFNKTENITDVKAYVTYVENDVVKTITNKVQVVEPIKLPAPIHGIGHQPRPVAHLGIGAYDFPEGDNGGFLGYGFIFTNTTKNEVFDWRPSGGYKVPIDNYYTEAKLLEAGIVLTPGDYIVTYYAQGNGITTLDSDVSDRTIQFTIQKTPLVKPVLSISGTDLTWSVVENAERYEVFIEDESQGDQTSPYVLPTLNPGTYTIKVVAHAEDYISSNASIEYTVENQNAPKLGTPTNLAYVGFNLTWDEVANAVGYEIKMDGITKTSSTTSFDLSEFDKGDDTYTVYVVAKGDMINHSNSNAASISVELGTLNPRLNAMTAGDMVHSYLKNSVDNGHYKAEFYTGHGVFNSGSSEQPGGFVNKKIRFVLKEDGNILDTLEWTLASMIMLHTPGSKTDFYGTNLQDEHGNLTYGNTYTIEIILVADDDSGYRDSLPFVTEFVFKAPH